MLAPELRTVIDLDSLVHFADVEIFLMSGQMPGNLDAGTLNS